MEYKSPKTLDQLKRMVEQFLNLTRENADQVKQDRDYYDGDQISGAVKAELRKRGQPPIYINKIANSINGMLGIMDAAQSDPQAFPRNVQSRDAADVATKVLRFLADKADLKKLKRQTSDNLLIDGCCAAIIEFDGKNINAQRIRWEDFIYDPLSREHDFSDSKFQGVGKKIDVEDVVLMFPNFSKEELPDSDFLDFNDDDHKSKYWALNDRRLVRVIDLYYQADGEWHRAVFTAGQILHAGLSDYRDEDEATICPIVATSYEVSRHGDRYGAIRHMRSPQDEINARRSRLLHLTNHRQLSQTSLDTAQANKEVARREAARADGAIPYGWEPIPASDIAQGQMVLLQQSMSDLDRMAPTPAVLGRLNGANTSGRARQVLQQAGYTELARYFGRFEAMEISLYRTLWLVARQYLTEPTWIRITDDPRTIEFLQINEPVMDMVAQPVIDPETQEPVIDPYSGQPAMQIVEDIVGMNNRLAELDVDIILSTTPDTVILEQETFATILEYATGTGISPDDPRFAMLVELSPMPNKREILERIEASKAEMAEQQGGPDPMQQAAAELTMEAQAADIEKARAKAFKDTTSAQAEQAKMIRKSMGLPD